MILDSFIKKQVIVKLISGTTLTGILLQADKNMNILLDKATSTVSSTPQSALIKGSKVTYIGIE
ncbi:LSM domain-containing protein [Spironucleus salmonicida]|uniref:LSM domain-containing protein n=1 Tax=Spironucleus salmonicida TaxID=348837 RepID=V6LVP5_9EUKA|nr:LSM domain-containing protein [Spironucleus salmonicida]|eukprot:EST44889.1 LSM domain-containing protein [Spironucleus salmonicida]